MKRILTIQDISCLGKCSVTIALPVLSAMGVETVILPTALLSAHTMFHDVFRQDLTAEMEKIMEHWEREGITFDAIYTGYLGTEALIEQALHAIHAFRREDTFVLTDPVMGDHGRLYSGFLPSYAEKNLALCQSADLILPNITEACMMTGIPYREDGDRAYFRGILSALLTSGNSGRGKAALTGVSLEKGKTGVMGLDAGKREWFEYQNELLPVSYHGTGDLFASVTAGAILNGRTWKEALVLACDHTARTIESSIGNKRDLRFGVDFEKTLPYLMENPEKNSETAEQGGNTPHA